LAPHSGEPSHASFIHRIRRDARHNQILLSRTVQVHEEVLRSLLPDTFKTRTYSPSGSVSATSIVSAWQAAG